MLALAAWRLELDRREHTQTIQTPMTLTSHVQSHRLSVKSVFVCYFYFRALWALPLGGTRVEAVTTKVSSSTHASEKGEIHTEVISDEGEMCAVSYVKGEGP